ncbi:MAG: hypothetical protein RR331_07710, partial [Bacteroides sp.]
SCKVSFFLNINFDAVALIRFSFAHFLTMTRCTFRSSFAFFIFLITRHAAHKSLSGTFASLKPLLAHMPIYFLFLPINKFHPFFIKGSTPAGAIVLFEFYVDNTLKGA